MGEVSGASNFISIAPNSGVSEWLIETANTVDAADTIDVTLATYGIAKLLVVEGWVHTTDNSVIAPETVTTSVTTGVLTITIPAGTDNDKRVVKFAGYGDATHSLT